jgi:hypothetical protein
MHTSNYIIQESMPEFEDLDLFSLPFRILHKPFSKKGRQTTNGSLALQLAQNGQLLMEKKMGPKN